MPHELGSDVDWIKWVLEIWIPVSMGWVPVSMGLFWNVYKRIEQSEAKTDALVGQATVRIENKLDDMRKTQEADQRALASNLQRISEQVGRLLGHQ